MGQNMKAFVADMLLRCDVDRIPQRSEKAFVYVCITGVKKTLYRLKSTNAFVSDMLLRCDVGTIPQNSENSVRYRIAQNRLDASLSHMPRYHNRRRPCPLHSSRKLTHYRCSYCGVALHTRLCFEVFHSVQHIDGLDIT